MRVQASRDNNWGLTTIRPAQLDHDQESWKQGKERGKIRETGTSALVHTRWERWSLNPVSRKMCLICGELSCVLLVREGGMVKTNVLFLRLAFALIFPHQPATISQLIHTTTDQHWNAMFLPFCLLYWLWSLLNRVDDASAYKKATATMSIAILSLLLILRQQVFSLS